VKHNMAYTILHLIKSVIYDGAEYNLGRTPQNFDKTPLWKREIKGDL
jgi:hypothetical protein